MAASNKISELAEIQETLRNAGLRSTSARIAVIQRLKTASRPLSHAEVATALADFGLDKATVFRNLNDLTDAGLLSRSELGDHVWRFELRNPHHEHGGAHPHFVCIDCGSVSCVNAAVLPPKLKAKAEEIGEITEILVRGRCKHCT